MHIYDSLCRDELKQNTQTQTIWNFKWQFIIKKNILFLVISQYHLCIIFGSSQWSDHRTVRLYGQIHRLVLHGLRQASIYMCMYIYISLIKVTDDVRHVFENIDKKWPVS